MSREGQQEYWNIVSQEKEFTLPLHHTRFEHLLEPHAKILDVGCGYGRSLNEMNSYGYHQLHGIDFSANMIERGKRLYPQLSLLVMDSPSIPYPDKTFDMVILFAVLTCIASNEEQIFLLQEIHRVLAPGGIVVVSDFLLNTDQRNIERYKKHEASYSHYGTFQLPKGGVCRHHSLTWVHDSLSIFETVRFEKESFTTMNGNPSNGYYFIGRKKQ